MSVADIVMIWVGIFLLIINVIGLNLRLDRLEKKLAALDLIKLSGLVADPEEEDHE